MKLQLICITTLVLFSFSIHSKTVFKCLADERGKTKDLDELLFIFNQDRTGEVFNNGIIELYWADGSIERIEESGSILYKLMPTYGTIFYENHYSANFFKSDYIPWYDGKFTINNTNYYDIKCVKYYY